MASESVVPGRAPAVAGEAENARFGIVLFVVAEIMFFSSSSNPQRRPFLDANGCFEVTRLLDVRARKRRPRGFDDLDALVAAVEHLADDPDLRATMGAAGRRWAERWRSPASVAEAYAELVEGLRDRS